MARVSRFASLLCMAIAAAFIFSGCRTNELTEPAVAEQAAVEQAVEEQEQEYVAESEDPCPTNEELENSLVIVAAGTLLVPGDENTFFVSSAGFGVLHKEYVLTAAHIVQNDFAAPEAHEFRVYVINVRVGGVSSRPSLADIVYYDGVRDFALLKPADAMIFARGSSGPEFVSGSRLPPGTFLCAVSFDGNAVLGVRSEDIGNAKEASGQFVFRIVPESPDIIRGSSGGPVYTRAGGKLMVAGIVVKKLLIIRPLLGTLRGVAAVDIVEALRAIRDETSFDLLGVP